VSGRGTAARVMEALADGATAGSVAARLGLPVALVDVVVDALAREGLCVAPTSRAGCGECVVAPPTTGTDDVPAGCLGCPLARRR
jgi:hypothetical protein